MEPRNELFTKFISLKLTEEEWVSILENYGRDVDWNNPEKNVLTLWAEKREIPEKAVQWINSNVGESVWLNPNTDGKTPFSILCDSYCLSNHGGKSLASLVKTIPLTTYIETFEKSLEQYAGRSPSEQYLQQPLTYWKGSFAVAAGVMKADAPNVLSALIDEHPHLLDQQQDGYTFGSLMGGKPEGWKSYLASDGSIFQDVFVDPATNQKSSLGTPLWLWFLKKKIYHSDFKSTLDQLLLRLAEGREPAEGDYVVSDDDWNALVENKSLIVNEIRMIEFEQKIENDWKVAIKENKNWRQWRSSEGANFMLWLCARNPGEFIRQAYKTKINRPLIETKDDLGRDFFKYLLTGCLISDFGSWRRTQRVTTEWYPEMMKVMNEFIDTNPKKGLLADWCTASSDAYFGSLKNAHRISGSYNQEYLRSTLKAHQGLFWNGLDYNSFKNVFSNPSISTRTTKMAQALIGSFSKDDLQSRLDTMDGATKISLIIFMFSNNVSSSFTSEMAQWRNQQAENLGLDIPSEITAEDIEFILKWMETNLSSWNKPEEAKKLETLLGRQLISLRISGSEETAQKATKRRM